MIAKNQWDDASRCFTTSSHDQLYYVVEDEASRTWCMFNHQTNGNQALTREFHHDLCVENPVEKLRKLK